MSTKQAIQINFHEWKITQYEYFLVELTTLVGLSNWYLP